MNAALVIAIFSLGGMQSIAYNNDPRLATERQRALESVIATEGVGSRKALVLIKKVLRKDLPLCPFALDALRGLEHPSADIVEAVKNVARVCPYAHVYESAMELLATWGKSDPALSPSIDLFLSRLREEGGDRYGYATLALARVRGAFARSLHSDFCARKLGHAKVK